MSMYDPPQGEYNPYASPQAEMRPGYEGGGAPPLTFGVGEIFSRTWAIYQSRLGLCIGVIAAGLGFSIAGQILLGIASVGLGAAAGGGNNPPPAVGISLFVLNLMVAVFNIWISIGQYAVMLRVAREQDAPFGDIFSGGPALLTWILASILIGILCLPILLLVAVPIIAAQVAGQGDQGTMILGIAVGVIIGVVLIMMLTIRLSQALFVIIDQKAGAIDAIGTSMRLTKGKFWTLFSIFFLAGLVNIAGALALLIGLIFTIPFTTLLLAVTYASMVGKPGKNLPFSDARDFNEGLI